MEVYFNLSQMADDVLELTARRLKSEIVNADVIPKNEGTLETSHHVRHPEANRTEIATAEPYARRLYMHPEYNFSHAENPNAKGQWFEDWETGGSKSGRAAEIFEDEWKKKYGGG